MQGGGMCVCVCVCVCVCRGGWCNLGKGGARSQKGQGTKKGRGGAQLKKFCKRVNRMLLSGWDQADSEVCSPKMLIT